MFTSFKIKILEVTVNYLYSMSKCTLALLLGGRAEMTEGDQAAIYDRRSVPETRNQRLREMKIKFPNFR
jgi:hypothetical protein